MKAEKKKGSRKSGLLGCFEYPAVADEHIHEKERRATSSSDSLPASRAGLAPSCSSRWKLPDEEGKAPQRKRFSPRLLAKIVRSAVFVTSLKARSGKAWRVTKQLRPPEASGAPLGASRRAWDEDEPSSEAAFSSSCLSSSSSGSSAFSTITSSSQPPLAQTEKAPEGKKSPELPRGESTSGGGDDEATSTGLCLVVLFVLFVLVFCGRLCAIIWTSGCLCFVLGRGSSEGMPERKGPRRVPPAGGSSSRRGEAEWEKRRVVLEGLLDRGRRP